MKYVPLLNLDITHTYYVDGRCRDFRIEATPATQRLLARYRCILKTRPDGVRVFVAVTPDGSPLISLPKGMTFAFQLWLQNAEFALFTDLAPLAGVAAPLYTHTQTVTSDPVPLELSSRQAWATEHFAVRQPSPEEPFILGGRPLADVSATDFQLIWPKTQQAVYPARYDAASKVITVDSNAAQAGDTFTLQYPTVPPRTNGVFADVEIDYGSAAPTIANGPAMFTVNFEARQARWKYYLVTNSASTTFAIADQDKHAPLVFDTGTELREPDPSDTVAVTLAEQYPDMQKFRFVSQDTVPCQQTARKSVHLLIDGTPAGIALPSPALRNYTTDNSPGESSAETALFHVIKFFTHDIAPSGG
jgi:hypothetical protein